MNLNQFGDLSKRVAISTGILFILFLLIFYAANPIVNGIVLMVVCLVAAIGIWEYAHLASSKGLKPALYLMVLVGVCEILAFYIAHRWIHSQELPVFIFAVGLGLFFLNRFQKSEEALIHVAVEFFGVVYVSVPLGYMMAILYPMPPATVAGGRWWLFYLILITKITDIGAYFIGRSWGKHRLAPRLSPKKTVEGAIAGFICAVLFSLAMAYFGNKFGGSTFPLTFEDALWLGMLIGIFGQVGDLAESLLKRDAVVKDSNRLPALGGVLDMIDSLIFTAPIVYFYLKWYSAT